MRRATLFRDGRKNTTDLPRPEQVHKVVTEKRITDIDTEIKENRHRNISEFNVSIGSVQNIVHDQSTSYFADWIRNLPKQWNACLKAMNDLFFYCVHFHTLNIVVSINVSVSFLSLHISLVQNSNHFHLNHSYISQDQIIAEKYAIRYHLHIPKIPEVFVKYLSRHYTKCIKLQSSTFFFFW